MTGRELPQQVNVTINVDPGATLNISVYGAWRYDPAEGAWVARTGEHSWAIVKGDLGDPPGWPPAAANSERG